MDAVGITVSLSVGLPVSVALFDPYMKLDGKILEKEFREYNEVIV